MKPYTTLRFKGAPEEVNAQWLEARKKGIGGSDAAAILGMNPYSTPYTVWLEKTGRVDPPDLSDNESVYWGTVLEDVVAREFSKRHPDWKVKRLNAMLWSKDLPFMFASLDRVVTDEKGRKGILEIKTAGERRKGDWEQVPDYYLPQVNHYLAVTGFEFFAVAVLIGGQTYRDYVCERDPEDIAFLKVEEGKFWEYVEKDIAPQARGGRAESEALLEQYKTSDDEYLEMLDQDVPELARYFEVGAEMKKLQEEKDMLGNRIKQLIGDHRGLQTPLYRVSWGRSEVARFDSKALKKDDPELYEKYMKTGTRDMGIRLSERN